MEQFFVALNNISFLSFKQILLTNPTNNFKFKNCVFGATNIVKKSDKEKYIYNGCK